MKMENEKMDVCTPATVDEVIEKAAKYLPYGYTIHIQIEKDGYNVELEEPDTNCINADGGDGIRSDINEAICMACGIEL